MLTTILTALRRQLRALLGPRRHEYSALPSDVSNGSGAHTRVSLRQPRNSLSPVLELAAGVTALALVSVSVGLIIKSVYSSPGQDHNSPCDSPGRGFQCSPALSHSWGQYSPYFSVPSDMDAAVPGGCDITFVQVLSRHGARSPTKAKLESYQELLGRIQSKVTEYGAGYGFIKDYRYTLEPGVLTPFGQRQMANSGTAFYERYRRLLATSPPPFIRASGQDRVVMSAQNWTRAFHRSLTRDGGNSSLDGLLDGILTIPEDDVTNNTLHHGLCTAFEEDLHPPGEAAQAAWMRVFAPAVADQLNANLVGANLSVEEVNLFMDLCPFDTVARPGGSLSPFCDLFGPEQWRGYDYLYSLDKWYSWGRGNALGPTQGVGWANELAARLTGLPVRDHTSTNRTLDADGAPTFPLRLPVYVDFSHDNDMTCALSALGLYGEEATAPLPNDTYVPPERAGGFAASWTVPFAARTYVEKMRCAGGARGEGEEAAGEEELVRILVNDRVVPLVGCGADALGRCTLGRFVDSLAFARGGGRWDQCFI